MVVQQKSPANNPDKPRAIAKPRKMHLPFKEREYFSENLALLVKSSVPIGLALDSLANTTKNKPMKKTLANMQADIEAGFSLADSLERSGIMSGQTLVLVHLGEQSGRLVENLELAATQEEKRHIFRSKVRSALIYPGFVLSLTLLVGLGISWFLLPQLANTFSQLNIKLPFITRVLIQFGVFLKDHGIVAVPLLFVALGVSGYLLFGFKPTKVVGQSILFSTPGVGRLMLEIEIAQFGYLLGTLLDAGLPITQALSLLSDASSSLRYKKLHAYLAKSLTDGHGFRESLQSYKKSDRLLPSAVQQMIIAGENSGSLATVLLTIGRTYEQKADLTTQNLEAILEPILLVVVWLGVMVIAVAVIVPIYSLVGGLNK